MNDNLDRLSGRSVETVVDALGYPDSTANVGDDVVYIYGNSGSATSFMSQYDYQSGAINLVPYSIGWNCNLKIVTENDRVKHWEYKGDYEGCRPYMERLAEYFGN
jgi:hypothetical protein